MTLVTFCLKTTTRMEKRKYTRLGALYAMSGRVARSLAHSPKYTKFFAVVRRFDSTFVTFVTFDIYTRSKTLNFETFSSLSLRTRVCSFARAASWTRIGSDS